MRGAAGTSLIAGPSRTTGAICGDWRALPQTHTGCNVRTCKDGWTEQGGLGLPVLGAGLVDRAPAPSLPPPPGSAQAHLVPTCPPGTATVVDTRAVVRCGLAVAATTGTGPSQRRMPLPSSQQPAANPRPDPARTRSGATSGSSPEFKRFSFFVPLPSITFLHKRSCATGSAPERSSTSSGF
jgi:hypothetical protein